MSVLTYAELEGYWISAGGNKALAPLMAAIALAESSGNPSAKNPNDNNGRQTSWGLWQISDGTHNQVSPTWDDPLTNAKLAVEKYNSQGLHAWGTYTSGAYKQYMNSGTSPQLPSGISSATQYSNPTVQQASLSSDMGSAITKGILEGFSTALGPVLKWALWFGELSLGFAIMVMAVIILAMQNDSVRSIGASTVGMLVRRRA